MPPIPKPDPLGMPIPAGYLFALKVFGFFLHMAFMQLWLAGLPVAVVLWRFRPHVAERLIAAMPFAMAFGINAGIVPLLFLQTLYPQFFYPATILQAWFWFLIIPLLLIAYTAVYLAAFGRWRVLASLIAALLLTWIGAQFAAAMTLTAQPEGWMGIFRATATGGAVHGFALALDREALLRLGLMAGMAFGTVAAFLAGLAGFGRRDSEFAAQVRPLVPLLYVIGLGLFGLAGSLYAPTVADRLPAALQGAAAFSMPLATLLAGLYGVRPGRGAAGALILAQLGVLLSNAIARQVVQAAEIGQWVDLGQVPVRGEWGSVALFLVTLLLGLGVLAWILRTAWVRVREAP
ncbi:hypothetical protein [Thermoflexus hugenholtzii]|uniref:Uncharacterized protein n=1 Tax=Thermoflexus hugenholtzii JAD2 TaxID=877466 RepID=A0A212PYR5_9CHLR|nr:hypothetical protein [Thermoflexus hugenholtzii]SNB52098.1 hypothetical protein SAMN02746019_00022490 [Thermoflexus hugenholtzii JAD2]